MYPIMNHEWKVGDWVSGVTRNDEKFHGYVLAFVSGKNAARIHVTASDHDELIGQEIKSELKRMEPIPASGPVTEGNVLNLIDLALSVRDEAWFLELTAQLKKIRSTTSNGKGNTTENGKINQKKRIFLRNPSNLQ